MKVVHEEVYREVKISVRALFKDDRGIRINSESEWLMGSVYLCSEIKDDKGKSLKVFDTQHDYDIGYDDYQIEYKRKHERVGLLKLKRKCSIIHISEEYDRVLPLFIQRVKIEVDAYRDMKDRGSRNKKITDGLPDSLNNL